MLGNDIFLFFYIIEGLKINFPRSEKLFLLIESGNSIFNKCIGNEALLLNNRDNQVYDELKSVLIDGNLDLELININEASNYISKKIRTIQKNKSISDDLKKKLDKHYIEIQNSEDRHVKNTLLKSLDNFITHKILKRAKR